MADTSEDLEDTMSSEEWTAYYEQNLATSAADDMVLAELQEMKEQLREGAPIDAALE